MERTKKISYALAEQILNPNVPMFDRKTNRMFGTVAAYAVVLYDKVVAVDVKNYRDGEYHWHRYAVNKEKIQDALYFHV